MNHTLVPEAPRSISYTVYCIPITYKVYSLPYTESIGIYYFYENNESLQPEVQECEVRIPQWEKQACDHFSSPRVSVHRLCQKCPRHITKLLNAAAKKLDN